MSKVNEVFGEGKGVLGLYTTSKMDADVVWVGEAWTNGYRVRVTVRVWVGAIHTGRCVGCDIV